MHLDNKNIATLRLNQFAKAYNYNVRVLNADYNSQTIYMSLTPEFEKFLSHNEDEDSFSIGIRFNNDVHILKETKLDSAKVRKEIDTFFGSILPHNFDIKQAEQIN